MIGSEAAHSASGGRGPSSGGHTPLVLSLTQLQGSGGLVILNSASSTTHAQNNARGVARSSPAPAPSTPSPRPVASSCSEQSQAESRGEVGGGAVKSSSNKNIKTVRASVYSQSQASQENTQDTQADGQSQLEMMDDGEFLEALEASAST